VNDLSTPSQHRSETSRVRVARWEGAELRVTNENIQRPSTWNIAGPCHTVVIHLSGPIRRIETQVNGAAALVAPLGPGEVSLIPADYNYLCQAQGGAVAFGTLRIGERAFRDTLGVSGESSELRLSLGQRDAFVYETVKRLAKLVDDTDDVSQMVGRYLTQALYGHLLQTYQARQDGPNPEQRTPGLTVQTIRHLEQYVQDHLAERIEIDALARVAGLDTRGIFRAFRREFRTTPAQYVIEQRLHRVRWLLTNSQHDITTIAMLTGFATHSHLTTTFKKHLGLTPQAFRSQVRS